MTLVLRSRIIIIMEPTVVDFSVETRLPLCSSYLRIKGIWPPHRNGDVVYPQPLLLLSSLPMRHDTVIDSTGFRISFYLMRYLASGWLKSCRYHIVMYASHSMSHSYIRMNSNCPFYTLWTQHGSDFSYLRGKM
jgi:hypothetical protein